MYMDYVFGNETEIVVCAHKNPLVVMNHEMRTPKHVNIALLSLLQETKLIPEQQLIVAVASEGLQSILGLYGFS